jgi:hypothetical protein
VDDETAAHTQRLFILWGSKANGAKRIVEFCASFQASLKQFIVYFRPMSCNPTHNHESVGWTGPAGKTKLEESLNIISSLL